MRSAPNTCSSDSRCSAPSAIVSESSGTVPNVPITFFTSSASSRMSAVSRCTAFVVSIGSPLACTANDPVSSPNVASLADTAHVVERAGGQLGEHREPADLHGQGRFGAEPQLGADLVLDLVGGVGPGDAVQD